MDGESIRQLIDGATYLFTNEYEARLTEQKTGWSAEEIDERVQTRVITKGKRRGRRGHQGRGADPGAGGPRGAQGRPHRRRRRLPRRLPHRPGRGLDHRRCAEVGSMLATYVIETVGTQEYELGQARFLARLAEAYGAESAAEVEPHLACAAPLVPTACRSSLPPPPGALTPGARRPRRGPRRRRRRPRRRAPCSRRTARGLFPMGVGAARRPAARLVVTGPARRAAAGRAAGQPVAAQGPARTFETRVDTAFDAGRRGVRRPRPGRALDHPRDRRAPTPSCTALGWAHSVETWRDGELVGGLYGLAIGGLFAGESMFHHATDASKVALVAPRRPRLRRRRPPTADRRAVGHRRTWRAWASARCRATDYLPPPRRRP